jgi:hypothetical protein
MTTVLVLFAAAIAVFMYVKNVERSHEAAWLQAQAAAYKNHCTPILIKQSYIDQPISELEAMANLWRERLIQSGNPYAEKIPITIFPYKAALTDAGNVALSWSLYEQSFSFNYKVVLDEWAKGCPVEIRHFVETGTIAA